MVDIKQIKKKREDNLMNSMSEKDMQRNEWKNK